MITAAPEFTLTRVLDAPTDLVWRAWTQPEHLAAWLPSTALETISVDVREGGKLRYTMIDQETGQTFPTEGVFLEVIPVQRLVFTWGNPDDPVESSPVVTLTLQSEGERTELTFHLRGFEGHPGDGFVYDGWSDTLDTLAAHVAGRRPTPAQEPTS